MLNLAVVGAGIMGRKVADAVATLPEVRVAAVVDPDVGRARLLAADHGAPAFASIGELAGIADAAYLGVPHALHESACTAALEAGLHVLVDKPLCDTAEQAAGIHSALDAAGTVLMVGFSYRFRAEWITAGELIAEGRIGTPTFAADTILDSVTGTPAWYWDAARGGGVLQLQSHHCFDRLRWLLDSELDGVGCVVGGTDAARGVAEQRAAITARFRSGALATIGLGFERERDAPGLQTTVVQGTAGHLVLDSAVRSGALHTSAGVHTWSAADDDWMAREVGAFASACAAGVAITPSIDDGIAALKAALAARDSARDGGGWVRI